MNKIILSIVLITIIIAGMEYFVRHQVKQNASSSAIRVVAAENFYGDIVKQLGGSHVQVLSVLSDPNADPHQYESDVQDAVAVAKADLVIENGEGYDTWMDKLLSASPSKKRVVLVGTEIADHKIIDNPHVWYGFSNIRTIAKHITQVLKQNDPSHASEFDQRLATFDSSLRPLDQKMSDIKTKYNGIPVGLTETIYLYQAQVEGLNVLTPYEFEKAIAEGNDPSADDVAKANDQIQKKQVKVLIYNEQTITPITTNLQNEAKQASIPLVSVWETLPKGKHYQNWMMDQLTNLDNALSSSK